MADNFIFVAKFLAAIFALGIVIKLLVRGGNRGIELFGCFDLPIKYVSVGPRISPGFYFGESPFQYARFASEHLQVGFIAEAIPSNQEFIIFPDKVRPYMGLHIEAIDNRGAISKPVGNTEIDGLLEKGIFMWARKGSVMVVFAKGARKLSQEEAKEQLEALRDTAKRVAGVTAPNNSFKADSLRERP